MEPMPSYLFAKGDLQRSLHAQEQSVGQAAQSIPANHALARSVDELAAELVDQFRVPHLELDWDAMTLTHGDAKVDVSRDPRRVIRDPSRPFYVAGTTITYHVPFRGEPDLFQMRPSTFSSVFPSGEVTGDELRISMTVPTPIPDNLKGVLDREVELIRQYVERVNNDVGGFNARLPDIAREAAKARRDKVLADGALVASLGIPVRRREDASPTYAVAPVRRKASSRPSTTSDRAGTPEPVFSAEEYEHILSIVRNMVAVIERSPKTFEGLGEEALRDHFLVQLNGQYEGGATGETFNFDGKTDILVRERGRNVFIAECKFWGGAAKLVATVDQLLGYASWRDTKTAIFIFNRNKDLSAVLAQVSPTMHGHPAFVREINYGGETDFCFVLRHRDDPERELTLTVMVFEVPARTTRSSASAPSG
jgi:hypothetical protein